MRDTTRLPVLGAIVSLAWPAILAFQLQNAYHINDAWFLGRVGPAATNAMGLFMMIQIMNFGVILTLARGTQSLVGRRIGAGNVEGAGAALAQGLGLALKVLVPLATLEWIFAPDVLRLIGGEGVVVEAGTTYLRTLLLFMPFMFAQPIIDFSFQGMGNTATPFRLQVIAVLVNLTLNAVLVLDAESALRVPIPFSGEVFEVPALGLGVTGAAIATGVSRMVAALAGFALITQRYRMTAPTRAASYRGDRAVRREILRVGLPAGSSTFLYAAVGLAVLSMIGDFGQDSYGGYAIGFRGIESVSFMIVLGIGTATGTVAAHAAGARAYDRARRAGHVGVALGVSVMALTTVLMAGLSHELAAIYTDDAAIIAMAGDYIRVMAICQIPQALEMIYGDAMAGAGSAMRTAAISIPGNLLRVPLAYGLAFVAGFGLDGVWYAIAVSALVKGGAMLALYLSRAWERAMLAGRAVVEARP